MPSQQTLLALLKKLQSIQQKDYQLRPCLFKEKTTRYAQSMLLACRLRNMRRMQRNLARRLTCKAHRKNRTKNRKIQSFH